VMKPKLKQSDEVLITKQDSGYFNIRNVFVLSSSACGVSVSVNEWLMTKTH
jgi:hypothetical protein